MEPERKAELDEIAKTIQRVMYILLAVSVFCLATLFGPDEAIVPADGEFRFPFIETGIRVAGFAVFGPLVLIAINIYLLLFVACFSPEERDAYDDIYIFTMDHWTARLAAAYIFFWLVPSVLLAFWWCLLPRPESIWLGLLAAVATAIWTGLYYLLNPRRSEWDESIVLVPVAAIIVIGLLWVTFDENQNLRAYALRNVRLFNADLSGKDLENVNLRVFAAPSGDKQPEAGYGVDMERVILRNAVLKGAVLDGANLFFADLRGAYMRGTSLVRSNLQNADLSCNGQLPINSMADPRGGENLATDTSTPEGTEPNRNDVLRSGDGAADSLGARRKTQACTTLIQAVLTNASLQHANLENVNLRHAILRGADLSNANLQTANLQEAEMQGAVLSKASLRGADLSVALMQETVLSETDLRDANMSVVILRNAYLGGAILRGAQLIGADMQNADLTEADLQGARLRGVDLRRADLKWANLKNAILVGANLQDSNFNGADLPAADLSGAKLQRASARGADFKGADLRKANLEEAKLISSNMAGADLFAASLRNARMWGVDMRGANFRLADLSSASLKGAVLKGANFTQANLQNADLFKANLEQANLEQANLTGVLFLSCDQLVQARNWQDSIRGKELGWCLPMPSDKPGTVPLADSLHFVKTAPTDTSMPGTHQPE